MRTVFPPQMTGRFMDDLASDMNTLVETLFGESAKTVRGEKGCEKGCDAEGEGPRWVASMDVIESETEYRITVDLPGANAETMELDVNEDSLSITALREAPELGEGDQLLRRERRHGKFHRSVTLPKPVDRDATSAEYVDGVLTVTLPKAVEAPTSRRVAVKYGG